MSENLEQKKESAFEIDTLVAETYNDIALWHNDEPTQAGLKQLSLEIVEKIANATLNHLGLKGSLSIASDEETKNKINELKKTEE